MDMEITRDTTTLQGKTPVWVPRQMASLWSNYYPAATSRGCEWAPGLRYVGGGRDDAANTDKVPDYLLMDMSASYDPPPQRKPEGMGYRLAPATCSTRPTTPATTRTTAGSGPSEAWRRDSNTHSDLAPGTRPGPFQRMGEERGRGVPRGLGREKADAERASSRITRPLFAAAASLIPSPQGEPGGGR